MLAFLFSLPPLAQEPPLPPPRGVVLVLVDDLGWSDLGCCGSDGYRTPEIDRLAAEGTRFTQAYASAAVCSPTRAAVQTGRAPARLGITDWIHHASAEAAQAVACGRHPEGLAPAPRGGRLLTPRNRVWLDHDEISLAELLAPAGWRAGYVGKWHLGPAGWRPEDQGYAFNAGGCRFGQPPSYFDPFGNRRYPDGIPGLPGRTAGQYLAVREADEALAFLAGCGDRPFLLLFAPYEVHAPLQAPAATIDLFRDLPPERRHHHPVYAAMVHEVDRAVGRVAGELRRRGLLDAVLFIVTSDNGGATHFPATDNAPLRRGKGFPYEGGLRVPLIVRWPGVARSGATCPVPVISTDLFPTLAAAAGVPPPDDRALDGRSLLPLLRGEEAGWTERPLVWHFPHYWAGTLVRPWSAIRRGRWKLIHWYEDDRDELYDLAADPGEHEDRAAAEPERVAALRAEMFRVLYDQGARFPALDPAAAPPRRQRD
ncbi:MAG: DUF4976 domain-containing protein [Planctomycetota bacterium]|nr:MAG: DUF4976 domain-containing protein [Planctomycetota bacterium]